MASLDLIRGVAVLGILAINIAGFAGPPADVYHPVGSGAPSPWDSAAYTFWLVTCEGKMRALFAILFGASMELFVTRADAAGRSGAALQLRRLLWLGVFGYLHWLLWWGDILFSYALAGLGALALRQAPRALLLGGAAFVFCLSLAQGALAWLPLTLAEAHVAAGTASAAEAAGLARAHALSAATAAHDLAQARMGLVAGALEKLGHDPLQPLWNALAEIGEALPYMLLGIVLLRGGFFGGTASRRHPRTIAAICIVGGGLPTLAFTCWALRHGFPVAAMHLALEAGLGLPHLAMAIGYAVLLVAATPRLLRTAVGRRIAAAGRMAFSNYIGTSIVMTALFGWGLGLAGTVGSAAQACFVLIGWALMLGWSAPWLARLRQGPLEWVWRSLVEGRALPLKR